MHVFKKLMLLGVVVLVLGCPRLSSVAVDPYLTAHTVINQVSLALPIAQGIFNQWIYGQTDVEKAKKAQQTFARISTVVSNGLKIAHDAVDVTQKIKGEPKISEILAQADTAWKDLYKFLEDLLAGGDRGIVVALESTEEKGGGSASKPATPAGTGVKKSAVTVKNSPIMALPRTLIP
jgi:hypothetical protein